jgi:hypothetical protein
MTTNHASNLNASLRTVHKTALMKFPFLAGSIGSLYV